ncbi:MAG: hypothetical protein C4534_09380 [Gaiellales bacterium]|nr:MAG: hypothetical protein C4534_09380 [Gaiellales bacterium]
MKTGIFVIIGGILGIIFFVASMGDAAFFGGMCGIISGVGFGLCCLARGEWALKAACGETTDDFSTPAKNTSSGESHIVQSGGGG